MQHPISNSCYIYYCLPIVACAYLTLFQYSLFDFKNLGFFGTNAAATNTTAATTTIGGGVMAGRGGDYVLVEQKKKRDVDLFASAAATTTTTTGGGDNGDGSADSRRKSSNDNSRNSRHEMDNQENGNSMSSSTTTTTTTTTTVTNTTSLGGDDHLHHVTGSFANCTANHNQRRNTRNNRTRRRTISSTTTSSSYTISIATTSNNTQDFIGTVLVSCQTISFRVPASSFLSWSTWWKEMMVQEGNSNNNNDQDNHNYSHIGPQIITGVLSSAMGDLSKQRRQSIRNTWAQRTDNTTTDTPPPLVYFLLAGPWENVQDEFYTHQDILWIDQEEVYNGEQSVLTLKTYSFFQIIHAIVQEYHVPVTHLFKTDDDSYVNLHALVQELLQESSQNNNVRGHDYFGQCQFKYPKVHRESDYKWPITNETYPEPWFPRYCQGAGFGISLHFLQCAAGRGHISNIRFMPFEDVAVGMLAERCGVDPERPVTAKVRVFRYQSDEVKKRTRLGDARTDDLVPPAACMNNKIVQHRIIDEYDMEEHHKTVLDPLYCNVTRVKRDQLIQQMKEKGIEWFG